MSQIHSYPVEVFYEDTDMAGVVYHANYLRFIERARSTMVRELGVDQGAMKEDEGLAFVVRRIEAEYLAAAKFGDQLEVRTCIEAVTGARIQFWQEILRAGEKIFTARLTVVLINEAGQPARLPANIRLLLH
ncbi:Acyl-CoA thioester hydrolase YbgC [Pseudoruegeria aquimaris]|uniref:Acyl-CoA thioester hydrolase YbgC n=1 Tax=Pseudoruegeria aquimaris TaxID=393663 RepID=A0A1Y5TF76_9RHOB|nr:tol-pal system-associated acyl-CoA thioesterase [Pseudoruegeria aquimaris]SLN62479.1 Acyl-CoA thioester hydrolase YbgC [Pseudoruegeria aquimaris]